MARQFTEFESQLYDSEFTLIDMIRSLLDINSYKVVAKWKVIDNSSRRYALEHHWIMSNQHLVDLTPRMGAYRPLHKLAENLNLMRMARSMERWDTAGRIVLEGSMAVFSGPARSLLRSAMRRASSAAAERLARNLVYRMGRRLVRKIQLLAARKFVQFVAAVSLKIARKIADLVFTSDMENEVIDGIEGVSHFRHNIMDELDRQIPVMVRGALADELSDLLVSPLAECLNAEDQEQEVRMLFAPLNEVFMQGLASTMLSGISDLIKSVVRAILNGIPVTPGESKQRFEQRVGQELRESIPNVLTEDRYSELATDAAGSFLGSLT